MTSKVAQIQNSLWTIAAVLMALCALLSIVVALWPERPARMIEIGTIETIPADVTPVKPVRLKSSNVELRSSLAREIDLYRSWSPEHGTRPLEVNMPILEPLSGRVVAINLQGNFVSRNSISDVSLQCEGENSLKLTSGSSNVQVVEAMIKVPVSWCEKGQPSLRLEASQAIENVGMSQPYFVSRVSLLKSSFFGMLSYFVAGLAITAVPLALGALIATRAGFTRLCAPFSLCFAGTVALIGFFARWALPVGWPVGLSILAVSIVGSACICYRDRALVGRTIAQMRSAALAWVLAASLVFGAQYSMQTGAGSWEPNNRYMPAAWSSDNELPLRMAETIQLDLETPRDRMSGQWSLSDRPPLMAAFYLLGYDVLEAMQSNNDGNYLHQRVFSVFGLVINALWAGLLFAFVRDIAGLGKRESYAAVALVTFTPFALFNMTYTWPKLLAATFAVSASAALVASRESTRTASITVLFSLSCALALLAHSMSFVFVAVLTIAYLATNLRKLPKVIFGGVPGLIVVASWLVAREIWYPATGALEKFALAGSYLPSADDPSLFGAIKATYSSLDFEKWMSVKWDQLKALFAPFGTFTNLLGPSGIMPAPPGYDDVAARLRWLDFYSLSVGNAPLFLIGLSGVAVCLLRRFRDDDPATGVGWLLSIPISTLLFQLIAMFPAFILISFSYSAVTLWGIVGAAVVLRDAKNLIWIRYATFLIASYLIVVWIVAPLKYATSISIPALLMAFSAIAVILSYTFKEDDPVP